MSGYQLSQLLDKVCNGLNNLQMTSADADFRFMALNDLINDLSKNTLDNHLQKKCLSAVLKCLNDTNSTVQNVAIKCITVLFMKLNNDYALEALDKLLEMITESSSQGLVAGIALKAIILECSHSFTGYMTRVLPKLVFLLGNKNSSVDQILDALDILSKILSAIGQLEDLSETQLGGCQGALWTLINSHPRQAVQKRACGALASLSLHLSEESFKTLTDNIRDILSNASDTEHTKIFVYALNSVSKASGARMGPFLEEWIDLMLKLRKDNTDDEISEYCLQTIEYWVLNCPSKVSNHLDPILETCLHCVAYDPNYQDDDEQNDMEVDDDQNMSDFSEEEDDDTYSDDDDMSWKTRKAAARLLSSLFAMRKEYLREFYNHAAPILINRFKERIDSVRNEIILAFTSLVKQTSVLTSFRAGSSYDRDTISRKSKKKRYDTGSFGDTRDQLVDCIPKLCKQIQRHFQQSKSSETAVLNYCLLKEIATVIPGSLESQMDKVVSYFEESCNSTLGSDSNLRLEMLEFMKSLFQSFSGANLLPYLKKVLQILLDAANDKFTSNAKGNALLNDILEALIVIKYIVLGLRTIGGEQSQEAASIGEHFFNIYLFVLRKSSDSDSDLLVREHAISTLSAVLCSSIEHIPKESVNREAIPLVLSRLKNESYRISALKFINEVSTSLDQSQVDLSNDLNTIMNEISAFLRKANRPLLIQSLNCLLALFRRYNMILEPKNLLNDLRPLLEEMDIHIYSLALSAITGVIRISGAEESIADKLISEFVPKVIDSMAVSPHLLNLETLQEFWKAIIGIDTPKLSDFCLAALDNVSIDDRYSKQAHTLASKCIAEICLTSGRQIAVAYCGKKIKLISENVTPAHKHLILLTLGEIGSLMDLSHDFQTLFDDIFNLFRSESAEDIRFAAALALGNLSLGNVEHSLPRIVELIKEREDQRFLLFITLKQIIVKLSINSAPNDLKKVAVDMWNILVLNTETVHQETIRNAIAECLGKLSLFEPRTFLSLLKSQLSSENANTRSTALVALRHTFTDPSNQHEEYDSIIATVLRDFLLMIGDSDQSVQKAALSTLIAAVHHKSSLIEPLLGEFLPLIYKATMINESQINYVEMGPFKHKIDNGLEARKAAYDCLYAFVENYISAIDVMTLLDHVIRGISDDSHEIKIVNFMILQRLSLISPTFISLKLEELIEPLKKVLLFKQKANAVKLEIERSKELARAAARTSFILSKLESPKFSSFIAETRGSSAFLEEIFGSVEMENSTSSISKTMDVMDI